MVNKICIIGLITVSLLAISMGMTTTVQAKIDTITITDVVDDVIYSSEDENETVSRPNIDIYQVICNQDGKKISLSLKLKNDGKITTENSIYDLSLLTTHNTYEIMFGDETLLEEIGYGYKTVIVTSNFIKGKTTELTNAEYKGVGTNTLTVTFNLIKNIERIITCSAMTMDIYGYIDYSIYEGEQENMIYPDAGGKDGVYEAKVGETVEFNGGLENGLNPADYEWLWVIWVINDANKLLEGQNPTCVFNFPDNYSGILYVYNSEGYYGIDDFVVNINASTTGGGTGTGGSSFSGSGLIMFIVLLAVIVIAGVAVIIYITRR